MLSDKIPRLTGFAFVACRTGPIFSLFSCERRQARSRREISFDLCGGGGGGGGYGYFLALHHVILFKNKVNRKQPKTGKPQGNSPVKGAAGMLVGSFKLNPQRRPILVWPNVLLTLKETLLNFDYMNRVNKTNI